MGVEYKDPRTAVFSINPEIYPLDVVHAAAYIMIDKVFIILDGDPKTSILAELRTKKPDDNLQVIVEEFNEELLNYSVYKNQVAQNKDLRNKILQRVMITNEVLQRMQKPEDPEGILKEWEDENQAKQ
ncbi:hypothetical protein ACFL0V_07215 [Nanoarchaeota archaeon]